MPRHDFCLVLDVPELTRELADRLHEVGCDDATLSMRGGDVFLTFSRDAPMRELAIVSAIMDAAHVAPIRRVIREPLISPMGEKGT
jgi:hypothetical protein